MATGFRVGATDFDDLFDPDIVGDGPAAAGLKVGATPLKYAALAYGTKRANVGVIHGGADVSNLWAAKGSASYVTAGVPGHVSAYGFGPGEITSVAHFTYLSNGTTAYGPSPAGPGRWLAGGNPSDYEARFTQIASTGPGVVTGATLNTWLRLSESRGIELTVSKSGGQSAIGSRTFRVEIRRMAGGQIVLTSEVELYAEANIA